MVKAQCMTLVKPLRRDNHVSKLSASCHCTNVKWLHNQTDIECQLDTLTIHTEIQTQNEGKGKGNQNK